VSDCLICQTLANVSEHLALPGRQRRISRLRRAFAERYDCPHGNWIKGCVSRQDAPDLVDEGRDGGILQEDSRTTPLKQPRGFTFPLLFTWTLPPLPEPPDLLVLATEIAGVGGLELPVEVSATDSFASVTDAPERSLTMIARIPVDLADVLLGEETPFCETLDRCKEVSLFLLDHAPGWLAES